MQTRVPRVSHRAQWLPRLSPRAYQQVTLVALIALGFIIVTGAGVRLTQSGLGCVDWPTCQNDKVIAPFEYHAMVEFVNRAITGFVSVVVIVAVLGSLVREPRRRDLTWWSLGLVAGVIAQILLGGVVVLLELTPLSVIGHFLVSMVLVWNAVVLHQRASHADSRGVAIVSPTVVWFGRALVASVCAVLVAGTVVTATGPNGGDVRADRLTLDIADVARVHGTLAWIVLALTLVTLGLAYRHGAGRPGASHSLLLRGRWLVAAVLVQGAIGYLQYFNGVPPRLVAAHVLGSVLVFVAVLYFYFGLFAYPAESSPATMEP